MNATAAPNNATSTGNIAVVVMSNVVTVLVMFGIASSVTLSHLKQTMQHHRPLFAIGLLSQTLFLPFCSFCLIKTFQLQGVQALVLLVLAACPGGTTSNIFAYWCNADVALSIALTATTNFCAFATMPLLLFVWCEQALALPAVTIPYLEIALALGVVLIPAWGGLTLKKHYPARAKTVERVGGVAGAVVVVLAVAVSMGTNWNEMTKENGNILDWNVVCAVMLLAPSGLCFAICMLCVRHKGCVWQDAAKDGDTGEAPTVEGVGQWTTVCLETGIQNVPLALSVASLTVIKSNGTSKDLLVVGLLAGVWSVVVNLEALVFCGAVRWYTRGGGSGQRQCQGNEGCNTGE